MKQQRADISCAFVDGPLDGERITVPSDLGSFHWSNTWEHHVYYRRAHPSASAPFVEGEKRVVQPSPPYFDHQPTLTRNAAPVGAERQAAA